MEFIEKRILEIVQAPMSASEAADQALTFLDNLDPKIVPQFAELGEENLLKFFASRRILAPALSNPARLREFIKEFVRLYEEDKAAAEAGAPVGPAPNAN